MVSGHIARTPLTPNQVTLISGVFGVIGAFLLLSQQSSHLLLAGLSVQLFCILDAVDGDIARIKNMCSSFGEWLDTFFDKLNDFLLIAGMSVGVYLRKGDISSLALGMTLVGLVFFTQFSMISNSLIFRKLRRPLGTDSRPSVEELQRNPFSGKFRRPVVFFEKHFLLEHCALLFLISFFALIDQLSVGLWVLTVHSALTLSFVTAVAAYRLRVRERRAWERRR